MALIDILDSKGNKTGYKTTIDDICNRGLWHNSVHAIIITHDNKIVAQKRSLSIVINPDMIELSAGGAVNTGETPEQAIQRETKEELGISAHSNEIYFINTKKYNKHYSNLHKTSKTFLYTYVIKLHKPIVHTLLQNSETSKIYFLTLQKAKRLVRYHRIIRLGRISPFYSYWRFTLNEAIKFIHPTIHFVCRGNVFRSRLAKEYLSTQAGSIKLISSGIWAKQNLFGDISRQAKILFQKHKLKMRQKSWVQTTQNNIDSSTVVVFMSKTILKDAEKMFDLSNTKYLVWDIADIDHSSQATSIEDSEKIYNSIVSNIKVLEESALYKNLLD